MEELFKKLGKNINKEDKYFERWCRLAPGFDDFLERNESLTNMKIAKINKNDKAFKEARELFIGATVRLIDNGLLTKEDIDKKLAKKTINIKPIKEDVSLNDEDDEDDNVPIASEVPADLLENILKNM